MPRLMSCALTEDAVRARTKAVTRRLGWWKDKRGRQLLKPGDRLTLVRKAMGFKRGESPVRIAEVEVVSVRRELLSAITWEDVTREGFPGRSAAWFIGMFCHEMKTFVDVEVTRIEFAYLDGDEPVDLCMAETADEAAAGVR